MRKTSPVTFRHHHTLGYRYSTNLFRQLLNLGMVMGFKRLFQRVGHRWCGGNAMSNIQRPSTNLLFRNTSDEAGENRTADKQLDQDEASLTGYAKGRGISCTGRHSLLGLLICSFLLS